MNRGVATKLTALLLAIGLVATSCAEQASASELDAAIGQDLRANTVLPLTCTPSRTDPVGTWVGLRIVAVDVADATITIDAEPTDARFGSHPSGCHDPVVLMPQSLFLLAADGSTILASSASQRGAVTSLGFALGNQLAEELTLVVAPTIGYETGEDVAQTTLFGTVERFAIAGSGSS